MANVRVDMKGFYKQTKKGNSGISKPSLKNVKKKTTSPPSHSASIGCDVVQPSVYLPDEIDRNEEVLRQFDLNMAYGPCIGLTRLDRWNRANKLGLNPPREVEKLLGSDKICLESLWDGRV